MKISIYLASFVLLKAMMPGALYAPPEESDSNTSVKLKAAAFENGDGTLNSSVPTNTSLAPAAPPPPPPLPPASFEQATKNLKGLIADNPKAKKALEEVERSHAVEVNKSRRMTVIAPAIPQPAKETVVSEGPKHSVKPQNDAQAGTLGKIVAAIGRGVKLNKTPAKQEKSAVEEPEIDTSEMTVQERMKRMRNREQLESEKLEAQAKALVAKGVKPCSPQEAQGKDGTKKELVQSVQKDSNPSVPADSSESKETLSVKNLASKFQGSAVQEGDLSKVEGPAGNKPALPPKPKVSGDKPVVAAGTGPLSAEPGEMNDSTATDAEPVVKEPVEEPASESGEPKTFEGRVAAFKQKETTADERTAVSKKTSTSGAGKVSQLKAKFAN